MPIISTKPKATAGAIATANSAAASTGCPQLWKKIAAHFDAKGAGVAANGHRVSGIFRMIVEGELDLVETATGKGFWEDKWELVEGEDES